MKEVTMPKLSDTMTEGMVVSWRKKVGEQVERGEVIAEVETDKATMELEAFASGVFLEIRIKEGETVPVGTVIGVIGAPDEASAPDKEKKNAEKDGAKVREERDAKEKEEPGERQKSADTGKAGEDKDVRIEKKDAAAEKDEQAPTLEVEEEEEVAGGGTVYAAPVVRRLAREMGIDLTTVTGSGPGGRVLREDLDAAAGKQVTAGEPLSRMRAAIARTVSESWRTIPHFAVTVEVRMDAAEQLLGKLREEGPKVPLTALLIKVSTQALTDYPRLNASLREGNLMIHPEINVGIVVRREEGLLVPVLHDCAELPLDETARRTALLVERARHGQLSQTELSGGTFAISNLGMYGVDSFVALILPPMAAVLAVGAVRDGVIADNNRPVTARLLTLTLSADHRIVDGAYAAEFLRELKRVLEHPDSLAR